ncbi:MBL fold metallo-hydrolase [Bdellovibrio sp. qaytius]|nr:MBL fold metallo-hydrolase [Bdellovibrio sp. qaytius]
MKTDHAKIHLNIGGYEIIPLPTGLFGLDGGAMFGTVPKALWEKTNPADEHNRIPMEARALLLKSKDKKVLIDCGNGADFIAKYGDKLGSKFAELYSVDGSGPTLKSSLAAHGLTANDITDVVLTHLHFDHAGGATSAIGDVIKPTFPNAKYYVQSENLKTAQTPNVREKASYLSPNWVPLLEAGVLQLVNGATKNLLPHISVWVSDGHTTAHQVVIVEDDTQKLIYCGDVIPTASHIRAAWVMGYDLHPLKVIEEKTALLKSTQEKNTYLFFEHDPYCDVATVETDKSDFKVKERFWLA